MIAKCNYIAPYIWLLWSGDLLETYRCVKGQLQQLWKRKKWLWRWLRQAAADIAAVVEVFMHIMGTFIKR